MENVEETVKILPKPFIDLITKWRNRKITPEFDIEICELSVSIPECIDDFRWHPLPSEPYEYKKWKQLTSKEEEEIIKNKFSWYEKNIQQVGEEINKMRNFNRRNRVQLQEWLKLKISHAARIKIEIILDTHSGMDNA